MGISMMMAIVLVMSFVLVLVNSEEIIPTTYYKHLQGPADQFPNFIDPTPSEAAITSDSFMLEIQLTESDNELKWRGFVPVDSLEQVSISIVGTHSKYMNLKVLNIEDFQVNELSENVENYGEALKTKNHIVNSWVGYSKDSSVPAKIFNFFNDASVKIGDWLIEVTLDESTPDEIINKLKATKTSAVLFIYNASPLTAHTQLSNFNSLVGEKIGFITRISEKQEVQKRDLLGAAYIPKAIPTSAFDEIEAEIDVQYPDGNEQIFRMHNVQQAELLGEPHQGSFSGEFTATESGVFHLRVVVKGVVGEEMKKTLFKNAKFIPSQQKLSFMRTTQHTVVIIPKSLELVESGVTATFNQQSEMLSVNLQAKLPQARATEVDEEKKYKVFAEVYGVSQSDETQTVPVCWVLGMATSSPSEQGKEFSTLSLDMSMKWFSKVGAKLPLTLKNIKVQDVETSSTLSELKEISNIQTHQLFVDEVSGKVRHRITDQSAVHKFAHMLIESQFKFNPNDEVTETMTMGPRPKELAIRTKARSSNHKVLLVHGYCSSGNPFTTSHFQNYLVFDDPNASRSNDKFAQLIWKIGQSLESFSIVGHSQGGLASVHLYTFYWSTADNLPKDENIRVIQSVGSPYGGCSAAGSIASIGKIFGAGCGTNTDLSVDGAQKWLKTIPETSQTKVYYYTTQNPANGKACSSAMDWILYRPNDGTSEARYVTALTKANNMGLTYGWCHTSDMTYPPQCTDPTRNAELNKYANGF